MYPLLNTKRSNLAICNFPCIISIWVFSPAENTQPSQYSKAQGQENIQSHFISLCSPQESDFCSNGKREHIEKRHCELTKEFTTHHCLLKLGNSQSILFSRIIKEKIVKGKYPKCEKFNQNWKQQRQSQTKSSCLTFELFNNVMRLIRLSSRTRIS